MIRLGLVAVVLAACGPSDREHDCAEVKKILEPPNPTGMPRRYWNYTPDNKQEQDEAASFDPSPYARLRKLDYRDAEVRDAVNAFTTETGAWTLYTPYTTDAEASSSRGRLAKLCGLRTIVVVPEPLPR